MEFGEPARPARTDKTAAEFIIETCRAAPGEVLLIGLGCGREFCLECFRLKVTLSAYQHDFANIFLNFEF